MNTHISLKMDNVEINRVEVTTFDVTTIKTAVIMYMYKNALPMNIQKLFTLCDSVYTTRQCSILKVFVYRLMV